VLFAVVKHTYGPTGFYYGSIWLNIEISWLLAEVLHVEFNKMSGVFMGYKNKSIHGFM
jgi:hypothetical protein